MLMMLITGCQHHQHHLGLASPIPGLSAPLSTFKTSCLGPDGPEGKFSKTSAHDAFRGGPGGAFKLLQKSLRSGWDSLLANLGLVLERGPRGPLGETELQ